MMNSLLLKFCKKDIIIVHEFFIKQQENIS